MIKSQITLKQLEAFVFVVDMGTFRAAASALGTTQPNISARINALENALDVSLMTRDAGSVQLTAQGHVLLEKARDVIWAGERLIEEAGRQDIIQERLRLGVTELIACTWLRDFLRQLKSVYPRLRVELEVDLSTSIERRLSERQLDLAFQTAPFKDNSFTTTPLGQEPYCWVCRPDIAKQMSPNPHLSDLFKHPILTHAKHTQAGHALHRISKERQLDDAQIIHSSALSACVPMVLEDLGIALLPSALLRRELDSGELTRITTDWLPPPLSFVARYDAKRAPLFVAKAVELAVDAMQPY